MEKYSAMYGIGASFIGYSAIKYPGISERYHIPLRLRYRQIFDTLFYYNYVVNVKNKKIVRLSYK